MLVVYVVLGIALFALAIVGALFGTLHIMKRRDEAELQRYLQDEDCDWESIPTTGGPEMSVLLRNTKSASSGIEMRVYFLSEPPEDAEYEGVCLSIIDPERVNGMILEGFGRLVDAMQFGDGLWNDRFLGDAGIMERLIMEKREAWDQMQMGIIVGHYSHFM